MIQISPSILSADFSRLGEEIKAVVQAGAHMIHLDVMDGHFVPNLTFGAPVVKKLRKTTDCPFDVHLMISNPDDFLEDFASAGADCIGVHVEACTHLDRTLNRIRELDKKPTVTLNPHTPVGSIENVLGLVDMVLIMSVNPGFGGQAFIPNTVDKIAQLKSMLDQKGLSDQVEIQVDGGIKAGTIGACAAAGARCFVSGSGVFGHPQGLKASIEELSTQASRAISKTC